MEFNKLTKEELLLIEGGKISKESSLPYDVFWCISWFAREVWEGLTAKSVGGSYAYAKCG